MRYWPPNELVLPFGGSYVCTNFGENRSRNATVRVLADTQTHWQMQTDFIICPMLDAIAMGQIIIHRLMQAFSGLKSQGQRQGLTYHCSKSPKIVSCHIISNPKTDTRIKIWQDSAAWAKLSAAIFPLIIHRCGRDGGRETVRALWVADTAGQNGQWECMRKLL